MITVEIYQCVLRLARLLGFDFRWPTSLERHFVTEYPEIRLVALIVTATKLVVTFDDFPRNPENIASPSTLKMDWTAWEKLVKAKKEAQKQASFDEVKMTEQDVFDMSTLDIDKYLNWYQETWLDDRAPKIPEQILDLFPVPPAPTRSELEQLGQAEMDTASPAKRLKQVQSSQRVQEPISTEQAEYIATVNRPGSYYQRSRVIEELNDHEKNFVALAAETIAVSAHELLRAVNTIENTLFKAISPPEMMDETYDIEEVGEGQSSP
jgi:RNA polymerase I-specific transcription initiation factor RRN7